MVWDLDMGCSDDWPAWFIEYREALKAELRAFVDAKQRGERSDRDLYAWVKESIAREERWRASLSPEQRSWLEEQEALERACRTRHLPHSEWKRIERRVDMAKVRAAANPLREYFLQVNTRTPEEQAEHTARLARITARAIAVLGSQEAATRWLENFSGAVTVIHPAAG